MTVSDGGPYVNGGETTESSTLSLDDGDIYVSQDGPRDAPHSCSSTDPHPRPARGTRWFRC